MSDFAVNAVPLGELGVPILPADVYPISSDAGTFELTPAQATALYYYASRIHISGTIRIPPTYILDTYLYSDLAGSHADTSGAQQFQQHTESGTWLEYGSTLPTGEAVAGTTIAPYPTALGFSTERPVNQIPSDNYETLVNAWCTTQGRVNIIAPDNTGDNTGIWGRIETVDNPDVPFDLDLYPEAAPGCDLATPGQMRIFAPSTPWDSRYLNGNWVGGWSGQSGDLAASARPMKPWFRSDTGGISPALPLQFPNVSWTHFRLYHRFLYWTIVGWRMYRYGNASVNGHIYAKVGWQPIYTASHFGERIYVADFPASMPDDTIMLLQSISAPESMVDTHVRCVFHDIHAPFDVMATAQYSNGSYPNDDRVVRPTCTNARIDIYTPQSALDEL